jgi:hypothetical protein
MLFNELIRPSNNLKNKVLENTAISELSNQALTKYKTAAASDAGAADKAGDFKRGNKRFSGIIKATKKQFANDQKSKKVNTQGVAEGYTTEKQILTRIRQIMYDRKLSGTESNAGELNRLKQQLKDMRSQQKDMRSQQGVAEDKGPCWKGYKQIGMKKKSGKKVPNCVPVSEDCEQIISALINQILINESVQNNRR